MADLNVNKTDTTVTAENSGQNLVINGSFESAPSFTAATNVNNVWIDGTAAGSSTNSTWRWGTNSSGTGWSCQFDTSTQHSGTTSMKLSTTGVNSSVGVNTQPSATANNLWEIPAFGSTRYTCTFWMATNFISGDSNDGAFISVRTHNSAGSLVTAFASTKIKTTTSFTQYTVNFTTGATVAYISTEMFVTGNTGTATLIMDAWFDDISLTVVDTTLTGNLTIPMTPIITPGVQNINGPKIWS